jgi:hypothetical protein
MDIDFEFDDAFAFASRMAAAPRIVGDEMTRGIDRLTIQGVAFTQVETPVRTGHGRRSIAHKPATFGGGMARGSYGTSVPYMKWVEEGRGPIDAGPGRVLRFVPKGSSTPIYRRRVGPAKGHHMFRKGVQRLRPLVGREFRTVTQNIIARMGA